MFVGIFNFNFSVRKMLTWCNLGLTVLTAGVISELIFYYIKKFKRLSEQSEHINEVMFFTDKGYQCKGHCYNRVRCEKQSCSFRHMRRILELLQKPNESLDICIYLLTCQDFLDAIVKVYKKGIRVRIIADADMADGSGAQIYTFMKYGIPVRMKKSPFLMHHKFFVIDNHILATGSCNLTMQALTGNWDNILITSVPELVKPFSEHFAQLWEEFSEFHL
ncbi:uncharacterized protein zuc [Periplaneta americana]|uniref:uncharacterized protein zuc n=1 Tax=Periplaneta americana TaxID=6978 RepID=UPI0037E986AE